MRLASDEDALVDHAGPHESVCDRGIVASRLAAAGTVCFAEGATDFLPYASVSMSRLDRRRNTHTHPRRLSREAVRDVGSVGRIARVGREVIGMVHEVSNLSIVEHAIAPEGNVCRRTISMTSGSQSAYSPVARLRELDSSARMPILS